MQTQATSAASPCVATISAGFQIAAAFLLGIVILYGAGFVQTSDAHDAAHDMRHSQGFPCH